MGGAFIEEEDEELIRSFWGKIFTDGRGEYVWEGFFYFSY